MNNFIENIVRDIAQNKGILSNPGIRPLVSDIVQRAQDIVDFINEGTSEVGLICIVAPSPSLIDTYFKGWKVEDFERLSTELEALIS